MISLRMGVLVSVALTGWASQYAPGVMDEVIVNQQGYDHLPEDLPDVDGYVAVEDCDLLGDVIQLRPKGSRRWEDFLIVDCSGHASTTRWMREGNILVELDYQSAVRHNTVGKGLRVEVRGLGDSAALDARLGGPYPK